eukprot:1697758-Amphidinium_carterae.1
MPSQMVKSLSLSHQWSEPVIKTKGNRRQMQNSLKNRNHCSFHPSDDKRARIVRDRGLGWL